MHDTLKLIVASLFLSIGLVLVSAQQHGARAAGEGSATGLWLTEKGDARIRVSQCGRALCGKVVWLKDPIDPATGKPQTDDKNPNPSLATRPMIGVQLFIGMVPSGPGTWAGRIYNGDDGKVYDSKVALQGPSKLRVEGCVGVICGGEDWTRIGAQ